MGRDRSFAPELRRAVSGPIRFPVMETVTSGLVGRSLIFWWSIWSGGSDQIDQTIKITATGRNIGNWKAMVVCRYSDSRPRDKD